jgi:FkbM family methyltransferase
MTNMIASLANRLGLTRSTWLRHVALQVLARVGQHDATITHHWIPGKKVHLHRFRHKGYWFYGRAREEKTMRAFAALIAKGDTVIELGAHIGYISLYLADLVGANGQVYVFEPSPDNLSYTRRNLKGEPAVTLVEQAANDKVGVATFFVEGLTGQNSTLVENYSVFSENRDRAFSHEDYRRIEVPTTTVDLFVAENGLEPSFMKIDVEGAELACLRGSLETLKRFRPKLMVEVTHEQEAVLKLMTGLGYRIYDCDLNPIGPADANAPNMFFIHRDDAVKIERS